MDGFDLTGQVAVISGGTTGIGLAMARGLLSAGASVAICGRHQGRCEAAVRSLDAGDRVAAIACDVAVDDQVDRMFTEVVQRFGRIDSCFANAGVGGHDVAFLDLDEDELWNVMRINLGGAFLTMRAAARLMAGDEGGSIVVTSSPAVMSGRARGESYAASKGALEAMMRGVAVELARHRIRVNAVIPGWFETGMTEDALRSDTFKTKVLPRVPMRRWGEPDDIAGLAVFLASPYSRYMTGQSIVVDGGYSVF